MTLRTGDRMSDLWKHLGFSENPYFTTPIALTDEGLNLFVGRASEIRRMIGKWSAAEGVITVIGGNIGTGKTSFLNVAQYLCMTGKRDFQLAHDPPRLIPAAVKVQLESEQSETDLLVRILRAAAESITICCRKLNETPPKEADETIQLDRQHHAVAVHVAGRWGLSGNPRDASKGRGQFHS